ncbi:MAG: signal peptidase II [Clostridia bacterium]|nr:signal peptidase II [Clostridia bacterium]
MVWIGIIAVIFLADSVIKYFVEKKLSDKAVREVAKDKILLRKLHNTGMACSLGEKYPKFVKAGSLAIWISFLAGYIQLLRQPGQKLAKLGGAFVLGGGASNIADRFLKGYVTDYFSLNVKWEKLRRLVFNVSDFFIMAGAVFSVLGSRKK